MSFRVIVKQRTKLGSEAEVPLPGAYETLERAQAAARRVPGARAVEVAG